jgi:hypothetical protein
MADGQRGQQLRVSDVAVARSPSSLRLPGRLTIGTYTQVFEIPGAPSYQATRSRWVTEPLRCHGGELQSVAGRGDEPRRESEVKRTAGTQGH